MRRRVTRESAPRCGFAGFRFPPEVIILAVRWYLRYGLSYHDVEELLAEWCIAVGHVTIYRWVQRFTPLLIDAARPGRHVPGDRWLSIRPSSEHTSRYNIDNNSIQRSSTTGNHTKGVGQDAASSFRAPQHPDRRMSRL